MTNDEVLEQLLDMADVAAFHRLENGFHEFPDCWAQALKAAAEALGSDAALRLAALKGEGPQP